MKQKFLSIVFSIFLAQILCGQNFPLMNGATWYFDCRGLGSVSCIERWIFIGDSLGIDDRYIKFQTEERHRYLIGDTYTGFSNSFGTVLLVERNDSLFTASNFHLNESGNLIADFNLTQGDSTLSPYYQNFVAEWFQGDYPCTEEDSIKIFQKSAVESVSFQNIARSTWKSYTISFMDEMGQEAQKTFSGRSIITDGQYFSIIEPILNPFCGNIVCFGLPYLICYRDNFSGAGKCADVASQFVYMKNTGI